MPTSLSGMYLSNIFPTSRDAVNSFRTFSISRDRISSADQVKNDRRERGNERSFKRIY